MTPTSIHRLINQHRAPRLWLLFQNLFGGNADKKRLVRWLCRTVGNVLEVGCSVGNIADAFRMTSTVQYVGLDIDDAAVAVARLRFRNDSRFTFVCDELERYARQNGSRFDVVLFAGVLHHVDDSTAGRLLRTGGGLLRSDGYLVIVEPLPATVAAPWLVSFYVNSLEQGRFVRDEGALRHLVEGAGLAISNAQRVPIHATPLRWPLCAYFAAIEATGRA